MMEVDSSDSEHSDQVHAALQPQMSPEEKQFVELLIKCRDYSNERARNYFLSNYPGDGLIGSTIEMLTKLHNDSTYLIHAFTNIPDYATTIPSLGQLLSAYENAHATVSVKLLDAHVFAETTGALTSRLIEKIDTTFKLTNPGIIGPKLAEYVQRAENIVGATATYSHSNMKKVDEFVCSPSSFFQRYGGQLQLPSTGFSFDKTYVALAAPSLEGKTQTAFTIRSANPLYFVMSAAEIGEDGGIQDIYEPFVDHSVFLQSRALLDLKMIGLQVAATKTYPSAYLLRTTHQDKKLFVLGFFKAIMEQAIAKRGSNSVTGQLPGWMSFYASQLSPFDCPKVSVKEFIEFKSRIREPFCLFLDEFLTKDWSIYVRNLARAVGLVCIVSNTNTSIANLVSAGANHSRKKKIRNATNLNADTEELQLFEEENDEEQGPHNEAWSLVFLRLDNVNPAAVNIASNVETLRQKCSNINECREVFDALFNVWFYRCRPGIAVWLAEGMDWLIKNWDSESFVKRYLAPDSPYSLASILQYLTRRVGIKLANRKDLMTVMLNGQIAKLGLMTDVAYANDTGAEEHPFKNIHFLNNHLYYLVNPTSSSLDFFLTFSPSRNNRALRIASAQGRLVIWDVQTSVFRKDEFFTMLSCLFINLDQSPNLILSHASKLKMTRNLSIDELPNINAIKLSGNHLEVSAGMACVEASHHTAEVNPVYSLYGQNGWAWLNNVVANCCLSPRFRSVQLQTDDAGLKQRLESFHIPFLYGINNPNAILDSLSRCPGSRVFAENYVRTKDATSIDGRFKFLCNGILQECAIECKNYGDNLDASDLQSIIEKAMNGTLYKDSEFAHLFIIFTNSVANPKIKSSLRTICEENGINLYRLKAAQQQVVDDSAKLIAPLELPETSSNATITFSLVPHHPDWLLPNPKTIGIIMVMDVVA